MGFCTSTHAVGLLRISMFCIYLHLWPVYPMSRLIPGYLRLTSVSYLPLIQLIRFLIGRTVLSFDCLALFATGCLFLLASLF